MYPSYYVRSHPPSFDPSLYDALLGELRLQRRQGGSRYGKTKWREVINPTIFLGPGGVPNEVAFTDGFCGISSFCAKRTEKGEL